MITIKVGHNLDPIRAMQKLKNKVIAEGLFIELKRRRFYAKPSMRKRLKREEAARTKVKDLRKAIARARKDEEEEFGY
jgi:small subunit ribosomal protein S21